MADANDLSVDTAQRHVLSGVDVLQAEMVPLSQALGRVTAAPVSAADSLPPFANSAMDGYAVRAADVAGASERTPVRLPVTGEVAAGQEPEEELANGTAMRITTGAPIPTGADAVVPVEDTDEPWRDAQRPLPDVVAISRSVPAGAYVRGAAEDVVAGETVLPAGKWLRPQEIGLLAALGVSEVEVVRRPRIGVLATGDELIAVDEELRPGKIRNSNSYALIAQVRALGAEPIDLGVARDTASDVRAHLDAGVKANVDLFISSAGVSVGAYDVVKDVLEADGDISFWRVRMRPGKPLAYGTYRSVPYLGLPGNPVSALVSFEQFGRLAILKMAGYGIAGEDGIPPPRPRVEAVLEEELTSDGLRETYVRGIVSRDSEDQYSARRSGGQGSHMMAALVRANALLVVPEGVTRLAVGSPITALMIDWPPAVF